MINNKATTHTSHPELVSGSYSKIADQVRNDKNIKGFTLIELLVVVLIIAILATIALPKYMITRDRAHLSGLMTIGGNVNDALDRRSLFDDTSDSSALDLLDISFKSNTGADCTSGSCRITVSGKDYLLRPWLNGSSLQGRNYTMFYSYDNPAFPMFYVYNALASDVYNSGYKYNLNCTYLWGSAEVTMDSDRCLKIGASMGGACDSDYCRWD